MCGILGTVPASSYESFKNSLDTILHRGPDSFGIETLDNDVSLGHRRLSILDLSKAGHQPMLEDSGRYAIVFNG